MKVFVHIEYNHHNLTSSLNVEETESLTQLAWTDLYAKAQEKKLPCLLLGTIVTRDKEQYTCKHYEGVMLNKHLRSKGAIDPLTRGEVLKVYYTFINCFSHTEELKQLKPRLFDQEQLHVQAFRKGLASDPELGPILFDGLNVFANEDARTLERVGQCQFIIGNHLMKHQQELGGFRWIWCAAQHNILIAQKIISCENLDKKEEKNQQKQ
jgi:hypothetical protein